MANESAQNLLLTGTEVKARIVALINWCKNHTRPVVPGGLPDYPVTVKDWHQSVTLDFRYYLVQKIVKAMLPIIDLSALQDARTIIIVAQARKIEGDIFGAANSQEEYYQLLVKKVYKIQTELEMKLQEPREMRLQQIQQVGPGLAPMTGNNLGNQSPTNDQAQCIPQNINHIQNQQTAQTTQSQEQLLPILQNSAPGIAMASQSAHNFFFTDNNQPEVKAGIFCLIHELPVVPGALPDHPAKDWPQSVTQDFRYYLVQKIVQAIYPAIDLSILQNKIVIAVVASAREAEGDMYGTANSREEYYQLISEKIYKFEEKSRKLISEMQLVSPGLAPMTSNNSGTQSPSLSSNDALTCSVCMDRERNVVFQPCGHFVSCWNCSNLLSKKCPVCRKPFKRRIKVYVS